MPDASGNVFVWGLPSGQLVHFLPALNEQVHNLAFTARTDAIVTVCGQRVAVSWLIRPSVDDLLAVWMSSSYPVSACTEVTRQLLIAYPSLPNNTVRPLDCALSASNYQESRLIYGGRHRLGAGGQVCLNSSSCA